MQQFESNRIGIISGCIGGLGKYLLQIQTPFMINLAGAILTAFLCGVAGIAGKEIYLSIKKHFKKIKS